MKTWNQGIKITSGSGGSQKTDTITLLCDFGRIIWSWTIWSWTFNNLEEYSKSNMLQDHIWNQHWSRSMFAISSWSSVDFKYGPGAYLKLTLVQEHVCYMLLVQCWFQIWPWSIFDLEYSSRLLKVQDHMVQDHIIRPKSHKSYHSTWYSPVPRGIPWYYGLSYHICVLSFVRGNFLCTVRSIWNWEV